MPLSTAETNVAKFAGALKQEGNIGLSAEQKEVAKKSAEKVAKDHEKRFGVAGALDMMAESIPDAKIKEAIEAKVEDPAKRTTAENAAKLARELGQAHYASLGADQGHVRGEVDKVITTINEINAILGMGGINKTVFIETMINDQVFAKKAREILKTQLEVGVDKGNLAELRKSLTEITEEVNLSRFMKDKLPGTDLTLLPPAVKQTQLNNVQREIDSFRNSHNPLRKDVATKMDTYQGFRKERTRINYELDKINRERTAIPPPNPARAAELTARETTLNAQGTLVDTSMVPYAPAHAVENDYLSKVATVDRTTNAENVTAKEPERLKAAHDVTVAETKAKSAEDDYVKGLGSVIERTTQEYLRDKLTAADQPDPEKPQEEKDAEAKKKKEEKDRLEAKAMSKIRSTLRNTKGKVNKAQAELYFNKLLVGDPRSALEPMLAGMPVTERDALLADPVFCENAAMLMVRTKLESGKITRDNVNSLADTDWGEKIIDEALKKEDHANGVLGKLEGKLQGKGVMERIRGFTGEHKKSIILALLAAIATGMLYPAVVGVLAAEGLSVAALGTVAETTKGVAMSGLGTAAAAGVAAYATYQANES